MGLHLRVSYLSGPEDNRVLRTGIVAAWKQVPDPQNPGKGRYVMTGAADPIQAAQLLEEAVSDGAYVWIIDEHTNGLEGLGLVWGADILEGRIRVGDAGVGASLLRGTSEGQAGSS